MLFNLLRSDFSILKIKPFWESLASWFCKIISSVCCSILMCITESAIMMHQFNLLWRLIDRPECAFLAVVVIEISITLKNSIYSIFPPFFKFISRANRKGSISNCQNVIKDLRISRFLTILKIMINRALFPFRSLLSEPWHHLIQIWTTKKKKKHFLRCAIRHENSQNGSIFKYSNTNLLSMYDHIVILSTKQVLTRSTLNEVSPSKC